MKKNVKYLWLYAVALFAVALVLVLVCVFQEQKASDEAANIQRQLIDQIATNEQLSLEIKDKEKEIKTLQQERDELQAAAAQHSEEAQKAYEESQQSTLLLNVYYAKDTKPKAEARALLAKIDESKLNEKQKEFYQSLKEELN